MQKIVITKYDETTQQSSIASIEKAKKHTLLGHEFFEYFYINRPDILAKQEQIPENFDLPLGAIRCFSSVIYPTKDTYDKIRHQHSISLRELYQHSTNTLDFALVTKGVVTLIINDEKIDLHPGDVVIQRGTRHTWHNYTKENATLFFVMVGAATPKNFQSEPAFIPESKKT